MGSDLESINFQRGWPSLNLLPVEMIKRATVAALGQDSVASAGLCYGPDPGHEPAREAIAAWLTEFYAPPSSVTASRICMTGGASQSMGCLLSTFTDPEYTRNVWLVSPTYMLVFRVFADHGLGAKLRAVPEDEQGMDLDYLRAQMEQSERAAQHNNNLAPKYKHDRPGAKVYKHVIYCVPTFANPSSRVLSLARRRELVRLAREFDALVIPDDVYDLLQWPAHPDAHPNLDRAAFPRLVDIDRELDGGAERPGADGFGNVCSNGSFSKLAAPGVRVGWVEGSDKFVYGLSQTGEQASGGAPSQLTSTFIAELLRNGELQKHISDVLRPAYAARYHTMMEAVAADLLPLGCSLPQSTRDVAGGYFLWLALPPGVSAKALASRCLEEQKLIIAPGEIFEVPDQAKRLYFDNNIRLCFAWEDEWKLTAGVRRLATAIQRQLADIKKDGISGQSPTQHSSAADLSQYK